MSFWKGWREKLFGLGSETADLYKCPKIKKKRWTTGEKPKPLCNQLKLSKKIISNKKKKKQHCTVFERNLNQMIFRKVFGYILQTTNWRIFYIRGTSKALTDDLKQWQTQSKNPHLVSEHTIRTCNLNQYKPKCLWMLNYPKQQTSIIANPLQVLMSSRENLLRVKRVSVTFFFFFFFFQYW